MSACLLAASVTGRFRRSRQGAKGFTAGKTGSRRTTAWPPGRAGGRSAGRASPAPQEWSTARRRAARPRQEVLHRQGPALPVQAIASIERAGIIDHGNGPNRQATIQRLRGRLPVSPARVLGEAEDQQEPGGPPGRRPSASTASRAIAAEPCGLLRRWGRDQQARLGGLLLIGSGIRCPRSGRASGDVPAIGRRGRRARARVRPGRATRGSPARTGPGFARAASPPIARRRSVEGAAHSPRGARGHADSEVGIAPW